MLELNLTPHEASLLRMAILEAENNAYDNKKTDVALTLRLLRRKLAEKRQELREQLQA